MQERVGGVVLCNGELSRPAAPPGAGCGVHYLHLKRGGEEERRAFVDAAAARGCTVQAAAHAPAGGGPAAQRGLNLAAALPAAFNDSGGAAHPPATIVLGPLGGDEYGLLAGLFATADGGRLLRRARQLVLTLRFGAGLSAPAPATLHTALFAQLSQMGYVIYSKDMTAIETVQVGWVRLNRSAPLPDGSAGRGAAPAAPADADADAAEAPAPAPLPVRDARAWAALAEELSRGMGPGAPPPRAAHWWAIAWNSALIAAAIALIAAGLACCTDVCDDTADRIAAFKV